MPEVDKRLADLIFITLPFAMLYFSGIIYLSVYLSEFSIQITEIELPIPLVLSYAFNVISSFGFISIFFAIVFLIFFLNYCSEYRLLTKRVASFAIYVPTKIGMIAIFVLVSFLLTYFVSANVARNRSNIIKSGRAAQQLVSGRSLKEVKIENSTQDYLFKECITRGIFFVVFSDSKRDYLYCKVEAYYVLLKIESGTLVSVRMAR